jgi:hypothetical protein
MTYNQRWLIPVIMTLLLINGGLMWLIFRYGQTQVITTTIPPPATEIAGVQTTTMTTQCRDDIAVYIESSRQRIYTFYEYYDAFQDAIREH